MLECAAALVDRWMYTCAPVKVSPKLSQQSFGISKQNFTNFKYVVTLCARNGIIVNQLAYSILKLSALQRCHLVTSLLQNVCTKIHA